MSRPYHVGLFLLGTLALESCNKQLKEEDYRTYLQDTDHGLMHNREVSSVLMTCSYRPTDLLVAQELAGIPPASAAFLDSLRRNYAGKSYFSLSLAQNGAEIENRFVSDATAFTQAVTYLGAGIAQDVYLVSAKPKPDSVAALTALYPRQYGSTGRSTVLLLFDTSHLDVSHGFTLSYHDTQFQLGTVRFAFTEADIDRLPSLKF